MEGKTTVKYLQNYIKEKDYHPELKKDYFLKLSEEVGELAKAMRQGVLFSGNDSIKETVDEELWDIVYYVLAIANCYDIDMEKTIRIKEKINNDKYNTGIEFEINR
ncbi:MAG: MazG nucleotide pyrophosphohydrolase domain-containing protein [Candidatus Fimenecus sp.]